MPPARLYLSRATGKVVPQFLLLLLVLFSPTSVNEHVDASWETLGMSVDRQISSRTYANFEHERWRHFLALQHSGQC